MVPRGERRVDFRQGVHTMPAPQLLITTGCVDVGVGLQGEKQRDSERRRVKSKAAVSSWETTGMENFSVADEAGGSGRISEVEKILRSKPQKPFLDLWAEGEAKRV